MNIKNSLTNKYKNKIAFIVSAILFLGMSFSFVNAATPAVCATDRNSPDCFTENNNLNTVDVTNFFPTLSINDLVGTLSTLALAAILIIFGFKIILAGFKWANNDSQDKAKKEAIKSLINGIVGITVGFLAYFIVLGVRSITGTGDDQIINCSNLYFASEQDYNQNLKAAVTQGQTGISLSGATTEFQKCISLSGYKATLSDNVKFYNLGINVQNRCSKFYKINPYEITDRQGLQKCFLNEIKKL